MRRLLKRIHFWSCIVWRPVTGPNRDEPPMTDWQVWWAYGLDIRTAWEVAGISRGKSKPEESAHARD